jgi:hypothetical protein
METDFKVNGVPLILAQKKMKYQFVSNINVILHILRATDFWNWSINISR